MASLGIPSPVASSNPPVDPNVAAQQMPPMSNYAGQGQSQGDPSNDFLVAKLGEIAASLTDVAKVISQKNPALMPIIQKMAQAGSMLMSEIQSSSQSSGAPSMAQMQPSGPSEIGVTG